jgi:hypothetical protein
MPRDLPAGLGFAEGNPLTIGRDAQVRINDSSLSRGHVELRFVDGRLRLRDLSSTNGTYLVDDNKLARISECFVLPGQRVTLGKKTYTIKTLLAMAGIFVTYSEDGDLVIDFAKADRETNTDEIDLDLLVSDTISRLYALKAHKALDAAINRVQRLGQSSSG